MLRAILLIFALVSPAAAHDHAEIRIFVIRSQLAQAGPAPIVFVGDSIIDGVHLSSAAQNIWLDVVLDRLKKSIGC